MKNKITLLLLFIILVKLTQAQTVTIGTQVWMTKNLDVSTFRNGDPIPEAKTSEEWNKAGENKEPAWCYYDNDAANGRIYGKLYNWFAVNDPRVLAPSGWHVPRDAEWTTLSGFLGGESIAGEKMKSTSGWVENGNGTNTIGFSGLPGGYRSGYDYFDGIGVNGFWWSASESSTDVAFDRDLFHNEISLGRDSSDKGLGLSVRCVRD
jgi:uncharacterized protein (TIGR02145 family)